MFCESLELGQLSIVGHLKGKPFLALGSNTFYYTVFSYLILKAIIDVGNPKPDLGMHLCPLKVKHIHTDQMSPDAGFHLLFSKSHLMKAHLHFLY